MLKKDLCLQSGNMNVYVIVKGEIRKFGRVYGVIGGLWFFRKKNKKKKQLN